MELECPICCNSWFSFLVSWIFEVESDQLRCRWRRQDIACWASADIEDLSIESVTGQKTMSLFRTFYLFVS